MSGRLFARVLVVSSAALLVFSCMVTVQAAPGADTKAILDQARATRAQTATERPKPASDAIARRDQLTRRVDWTLLATAFVLPTLAGLLIASALWFLGDDEAIGTAIGAAVILVAALALFAREFVELSRMHAACQAAQVYCPTFPGDLSRYRIVGFTAFADIALLFVVSLRIAEWRRHRVKRT